MKSTKESDVALRADGMKIKESEYMQQVRKRLSEEVSPFKSPEKWNDDYMRKMVRQIYAEEGVIQDKVERALEDIIKE